MFFGCIGCPMTCVNNCIIFKVKIKSTYETSETSVKDGVWVLVASDEM